MTIPTPPAPEPTEPAPTKEKDKVELWLDDHPKSVGGIGCLILVVIVAVVAAIFTGGSDKDDGEKSGSSSPSSAAVKSPEKSESQKREALVTKAVAAVQKTYDKLPERKDLTLEGHYKSKTEVCVDQTTPAGDVFGFIVVKMPKGTFGDVYDGTCKKPAPDAGDVTKAIKDKLSKSNRDVKRAESVAYNDDAGLGAVVIRWAINDNVTEGLTKKSAKLDISEMLEVIQGLQEDGLNVNQVTFSGTYPLSNDLGEEKEVKVVNATYSGDTVSRIKFDSFLNKNVYEIADESTIHPAFED